MNFNPQNSLKKNLKGKNNNNFILKKLKLGNCIFSSLAIRLLICFQRKLKICCDNILEVV
jgi:hypothetical protein